MIKKLQQKSGFTLIEMIVSLGIFSMVVTTAVGALLVLISGNQRLQAEQNVMTNLTFALDSMTREIRTGYNYYCSRKSSGINSIFGEDGGAGNRPHENLGNSTDDCTNNINQGDKLQGVSFIEGGDSISGTTANRVLYFYDKEAKTIKRKVGNNNPQSIISSSLQINKASFFVSGTNKLSGTSDVEQPTVTIYLEAQEVGSDKKYYLQTSVTQRILDL